MHNKTGRLNHIRRDTTLKLYKITVVPVLVCGSERWTLTIEKQMKIEALEIKFLSSVV